MPAKVSFADWLKRAIDTHGDLYDYSNSEESYKGAGKHVLITCRKHGDFKQIAKIHSNGSHCPECATKKRGNPIEDLSGKVFGKLTAIRLADERKNGQTLWILRCQCGNEVKIQTSALKKRKDPTCGHCKTHDANGNPLNIDLTNYIKSFKPKGKNVAGQRFGKLTPKVYYVKVFDKKPERRGYWHCECDCGNTAEIPASNLLKPDSNKHATRSCGCSTGGAIDLEIGSRYGRLTVLKRSDTRWKESRRAWKCKCECGAEVVVSSKNLLSGHSKSCGCLMAELTSERNKLDITGER